MSAFRWIRCECCATGRKLTTHHCWPKAESGHGGAEVTLCERCHSEAHRIWGPGDRYRGPREAKPTIVGLRRHMDGVIEAARVAELENRCRNLESLLESHKRRHRQARQDLRRRLKDAREAQMAAESDRDDVVDRMVDLENALGVES